MLTLQDCIALCELTEAEIAAIAEHEHVPDIVAIEIGQYLCRRPDGTPAIKAIIRDDIDAAYKRGDEAHAIALKLVLKRFVETHPRTAT